MKKPDQSEEQDQPLKETGDILDPTAGARKGEKSSQEKDPLADTDGSEDLFPPENQRPSEAAGEDFS